MERWSKKQFMELVAPCGYRVRIWWWFKRHEYVTLLDVVNYRLAPDYVRTWIVGQLDGDLWYRCYHVADDEHLDAIRAELEAS